MKISSKISCLSYASKLISALVILIAITSCGGSTASQAENTADVAAADTTATTDADNYSPFVIYNVDINCDAIKNGDFIPMSELPYSDRPDSSYEGFTLPLTKAVITSHKDVIGKLAGNVTTYIIDGKTSDKNDFDALDAEKIQRVTIDGPKLIIETRFALDEPNPDVKMAVDEESRILRRNAQK